MFCGGAHCGGGHVVAHAEMVHDVVVHYGVDISTSHNQIHDNDAINTREHDMDIAMEHDIQAGVYGRQPGHLHSVLIRVSPHQSVSSS